MSLSMVDPNGRLIGDKHDHDEIEIRIDSIHL